MLPYKIVRNDVAFSDKPVKDWQEFKIWGMMYGNCKDSNFGSGWFVHTVLHNAVDYGFLPVLTYDDVRNEEDIEIMRQNFIFVPYKTSDDSLLAEVKNVVTLMLKSHDTSIPSIKRTDASTLGLNVDFCQLKFSYEAWIGTPKKPRIIYAVLLSSNFVDSCPEDVGNKILRNIAIKKAVSLSRRLTNMAKNLANSKYV